LFIGKVTHALREVFEEDKTEDVVSVFVGIHLATESVGDVPELFFEFFFMSIGHGGILILMFSQK
jgi:hypothetical protein